MITTRVPATQATMAKTDCKITRSYKALVLLREPVEVLFNDPQMCFPLKFAFIFNVKYLATENTAQELHAIILSGAYG